MYDLQEVAKSTVGANDGSDSETVRSKERMGQIPRLYVPAGFPAFSNTAIDMFGPLQIRIGRKTRKEALVIIFTCLTTEAVNLELVTQKLRYTSPGF